MQVTPPLVSAVMITGKSFGRMKLAAMAIESFRRQTYPNKELVIVNTGAPLRSERESDGIYEHCLMAPLTLGELRAFAQKQCLGDYIIQWDDDDWSHPDRISRQMQLADKGYAVLLKSQVRCDLLSGVAFAKAWPQGHELPGIPGTMLYPNRNKYKWRTEARHEDTHFLQDNFKEDGIVVDYNLSHPHLYLRFYHGRNTWDRQHIMQGAANSLAETHPDAAEYLQQVLTEFGLSGDSTGT